MQDNNQFFWRAHSWNVGRQPAKLPHRTEELLRRRADTELYGTRATQAGIGKLQLMLHSIRRSTCLLMVLPQLRQSSLNYIWITTEELRRFCVCLTFNNVKLRLRGHDQITLGLSSPAVLYKKIRTDYADAIDHGGQPLVDGIKAESK